jgi:hypothetical protein
VIADAAWLHRLISVCFCPRTASSDDDSEGRTIWIADAHRDDGQRFVVYADEKPTAFLDLERVIRESMGAILAATRRKDRTHS